MTKHPEIGYRILSTVSEMKEMAESVLAHHERYDGKGYPRGLKGDAIPLHARIITLADAFDAMISVRPYRDALSREEAIEEVKRNTGTQFDPLVAKAFLSLMEDPAYQIPNIADYQEMNDALEDVLKL
jgi:HD-GYP domain-containing protein (c-di-GMP phosphodiesterase class II)